MIFCVLTIGRFFSLKSTDRCLNWRKCDRYYNKISGTLCKSNSLLNNNSLTVKPRCIKCIANSCFSSISSGNTNKQIASKLSGIIASQTLINGEGLSVFFLTVLLQLPSFLIPNMHSSGLTLLFRVGSKDNFRWACTDWLLSC